MAVKEKLSKRLIIHIILILACISALYPIINVVSISLRPGDRAYSTSLEIIPKDATFDAFKKVLFEKGYDGGKARVEEMLLTELKAGNKNEMISRYQMVIAEKKENGEKFDGKQKMEYDILMRDKNLPMSEIDAKIVKLQILQNKLYYKFFNAAFWIWFKNSMIVSFFTVLFGVTFAATAGYAFSRFNFPGKKFGLTFFLITQMFPPTMLLLPMYLVMSKLQLTNTYFGLILMYTTTALPLCVWQMKGYYDTIPYSLEEAALIDGASPFKAFYIIILPLVKPGIVVTALFSFMSSWTDFIVANVMMQREELKTLPLGLQSMNGRYLVEWANFSAASILVMIPAVLLFMYLSKFLVSGLTLGGVKE